MTGHFTSYENRTDHELATSDPIAGASVRCTRYIETSRPLQLCGGITSPGIDERLPVMNFGESESRGVDGVMIIQK